MVAVCEYTVVVRVRGFHEYVTRRDRAEAEAIAARIRQSGRFCGWRAKVVEMLAVRRGKV